MELLKNEICKLLTKRAAVFFSASDCSQYAAADIYHAYAGRGWIFS